MFGWLISLPDHVFNGLYLFYIITLSVSVLVQNLDRFIFVCSDVFDISVARLIRELVLIILRSVSVNNTTVKLKALFILQFKNYVLKYR